MLIENINNYIEDLQDQLGKLRSKDAEILFLINKLNEARLNHKQIFIMGNGGSGSTASHWMNDFNKGMNMDLSIYNGKPRFKMICLNDNIPTMLALANDSSYDQIFVEQLKNFMAPGDLVIGISGSGNSGNVWQAIEWANHHGGDTFAIIGFDGGQIKNTAKNFIHIETNNMGMFEDISLIIDHIAFDCYKNGNF